jgi:hypothetical protein
MVAILEIKDLLHGQSILPMTTRMMLSDDAISTDPRITVINYGNDNIDCDGGMKETMMRRRKMKMKEAVMRRRGRKMVTMIRVVMKVNRAMKMTVTMRMGMRMTMRMWMRIMMTLTMRTTRANL